MTAKMSVLVFRFVTQCGLIGSRQSFGETYRSTRRYDPVDQHQDTVVNACDEMGL